MTTYRAILVPGGYYHISNHAVGSEKLFVMDENYRYFLWLFRKYIWPLARVFSYSLQPDQFEFFLRIREENVVWERMQSLAYRRLNSEDIIPVFLLQQFSNFFNAYTKAFNRQQARKGKLFIEPFNRQALTESEHFAKLIYEMHVKPVKQGLCAGIDEWSHTSYQTIQEGRNSWLQSKIVLGWFGSLSDYRRAHEA